MANILAPMDLKQIITSLLEVHKSYWYRLRNQRCLIPVSGTYEHRKIKGWAKKVLNSIVEKDRDLFYISGPYQWHETVAEDGGVEKVETETH